MVYDGTLRFKNLVDFINISDDWARPLQGFSEPESGHPLHSPAESGMLATQAA
jgi:hypothetical protein